MDTPDTWNWQELYFPLFKDMQWHFTPLKPITYISVTTSQGSKTFSLSCMPAGFMLARVGLLLSPVFVRNTRLPGQWCLFVDVCVQALLYCISWGDPSSFFSPISHLDSRQENAHLEGALSSRETEKQLNLHGFRSALLLTYKARSSKDRLYEVRTSSF